MRFLFNTFQFKIQWNLEVRYIIQRMFIPFALQMIYMDGVMKLNDLLKFSKYCKIKTRT